MGHLIKRPLLSIGIIAALSLGTPMAIAATPKPTVKTTVRATPKPTKKPVVKKKTVVKKKAVVKKKTVATKRPVYVRRAVGVTPSPSPTWPPKGFHANGGIYAKVPTSTELLGVLSASPVLAKKFKVCAKYACGVVQVASYSGCTWWEITSTLSGPASATDRKVVTFGSIRTTAAATKPKQIVTLLLISSMPLKTNVSVRNINITCYHSPRTEPVPTNKYSASSPSPTPSPTPSPSESETPMASPSPMPSDSATPTPTN